MPQCISYGGRESAKAATLQGKDINLQRNSELAADPHTAAAGKSLNGAYTFDGVRYVFDNSDSLITVISFAKVGNDLLAFANQNGDLWFVELQNSEPRVIKADKIHVKAIHALDWSFDNSQMLTCGEDGALCIWDTSNGSCIRSMSLLVPIKCCRFHRLNPNLAIIGTSQGMLEVYNCSSGTLHQKYAVATAFQWDLQVTAVESSNHHVFVGDSHGFLHLYRMEMHEGLLQRLIWHSKLRATTGGRAAVVQIQYIPFCRATDTPVLLVSARDSAITIIKVHEKSHWMETHSCCQAPPMAHDLRAVVCPLSIIQEVPLVTLGGEDTNVHIYNVSGKGSKPVVVTTLKGHRAPVLDVSWAFDESLLASADSDGLVIVWKRASR